MRCGTGEPILLQRTLLPGDAARHPVSWRLPASGADLRAVVQPVRQPRLRPEQHAHVHRQDDDPAADEQHPLPVLGVLRIPRQPLRDQVDVEAEEAQPDQGEQAEGHGGVAIDVGSEDLHEVLPSEAADRSWSTPADNTLQVFLINTRVLSAGTHIRSLLLNEEKGRG